MIVDPFKALEPGRRSFARPDEIEQNNQIRHWESGDAAAADKALAGAQVRVVQGDMHIPRIHVASIETCGCIADWDAIQGQLDTAHNPPGTPRDPHGAGRLVSGPAGAKTSGSRRTTSAAASGARFPCIRATSLRSWRRSRWASRSSGSRTGQENLQADSFARDYHIHAELDGNPGGPDPGLKVRTPRRPWLLRSGGRPDQFPAGLFNVITGSYDFPNAFVEVDGVYTNKPPGGVAYRCSFRVTEAVHAIERMVDHTSRHEVGKDPAQLRMENFIKPEPVPVPDTDRIGSTDWGDYGSCAPPGHGHDRLRGPADASRPRSVSGAS